MKFRLMLLLTLVVGLALTHTAKAQVSVYLEGSATQLANDYSKVYPVGGTLGIVYDGPMVFKNHVLLSADIQTRYTQASGSDERFISALVGPRMSFPIKKWKLTPFGDFLVGFARYRSAASTPDISSGTEFSTTDNLWGTTVGIQKQLTARFDVLADYSFTEFGLNNGEYNPQSYSVGVVYHFVKR